MNRLVLGIPALWNVIWGWVTFQGPTSRKPDIKQILKERKHQNIPILSDYSIKPKEEFWDNFPKMGIPTKVSTGMNVHALAALLEDRKMFLNRAEYGRGLKTVAFLSEGAPSHQKTSLPAVFCRNAKTAYEYGAQLTDTVAEWVQKGFVAGPFSNPPLPAFRVNPLLVIAQKGKIRPVLDVSSPAGRSFNDNIQKSSMEKVFMSSPQKFSYSVLVAGKNSLMTKFDMKDAYKNVPCALSDLRLQGFEWCGKYFAETAQIFGAVSAVPNYDTMGNTVSSLAKCVSSIPKSLVHRQIDDVPLVAPAATNWCQEFTVNYREVCKIANVQLAEDCPKQDKAFSNSTHGKVLGIEFRTENLSWKLPEDKRVEYSNLIHDALAAGELGLEACQKLTGKLNFVCSMAPWARTFLRPLQLFQSCLEESAMHSNILPDEAKKDLLFWWKFLSSQSDIDIPIAHPTGAPPLQYKTFTTDAAGWKVDGSSLEVGLGCVGLDEEGEIFFANQELWDTDSVLSFFDGKGKYLGNKTTTLEFAGILIPFLLCPLSLCNQHVVVGVDNISCLYAWDRGYSKEDNTASVLVRTLVLLSARLSCVVHIVHVPRDTTWESKLADRLSRRRTTRDSDRKLLSSFRNRDLPSSFRNWMDAPTEDWDLYLKVVSDV